MAVAFDAKVTADTTTNSGTSLNNTNLTVGSGANRALIATAQISNISATSLACTWNGVSMTLAGTPITGAVAVAAIFYLANPASGNNTLTFSYSGVAGNIYLGAASFTGADQVTTVSNYTTASSNGGTVTSSSTGAAVDSIANQGAGAPTQTQIYNDRSGSIVNGGSSYNIGSASAVFSWTAGTNNIWAGVAVNPVSASATFLFDLANPLR